MDTERLSTLLFILLIPLISSMLLYKFLPSNGRQIKHALFPPDDIKSYDINLDTANRKIKISKTIAIDKGYLGPVSQ